MTKDVKFAQPEIDRKDFADVHRFQEHVINGSTLNLHSTIAKMLNIIITVLAPSISVLFTCATISILMFHQNNRVSIPATKGSRGAKPPIEELVIPEKCGGHNLKTILFLIVFTDATQFEIWAHLRKLIVPQVSEAGYRAAC